MNILTKLKSFICKEDINYYNQKLQASNIACKELNKQLDKLETELKDIKGNKNIKAYTFKVNPVIYPAPVKITSSEIESLMYCEGAKAMMISDSYVYGIDKDTVQEIINENFNIENATYIKEEYDCDDFASAMYGLFNQPTLGRFAFGFARSVEHAFNFFIDRNKKIWIVEPQNNTIMTPEEAVKNHKCML